jgi:hypothetical protein
MCKQGGVALKCIPCYIDRVAGNFSINIWCRIACFPILPLIPNCW